jgi:ribosomal protein S18 acetylase RimI-like enzyme
VCTATYAHDSQKGPIAWIREVAVRPEYQRMGIGRKLVTQALSYGKENGAVRGFLQADECNIYAIHLYESLGFVSNKHEVQIDMFK